MTEVAILPAKFLENIDWVNQPPPPQARDAHALHFFLVNVGAVERPPVYEGLLFFRKGSAPSSPITNLQNGLDGSGHRIFADGVAPEQWARVHVRFRTQPTARIDVVMTLHGAEPTSHLPGTVVRGVEPDVVDPDESGSILLDPGTSNHWSLTLRKTTVFL